MNPRLVVHHHVVIRGIRLKDARQLRFLVHADHNSASNRFGQPAALDFQRLVDGIAIRQNHRQAAPFEPFQCLEHVRIEPILERVVVEDLSEAPQESRLTVLGAEAFDGRWVVDVVHFGADLFVDFPEPGRSRLPEQGVQFLPNIRLQSVVVEQSIVHVEKDNQRLSMYCHLHVLRALAAHFRGLFG